MVPQSRRDSVNSQDADDISPTSPPQRAVEESPSSRPILSVPSPTRVPDSLQTSPQGQNLGHQRRSTTTIGGRVAASRRRFPVINSRRDSQRSIRRTTYRVARQYRRMGVPHNYQRPGSFLQYISSVEDLSRAIASGQQARPSERGNTQPLASYPSRLLRARRIRRGYSQSWIDPPTPTPTFGHDVVGQTIQTPRPSHPPTSILVAPAAEPVPETTRLSMDSQSSTDSDVTEHGTRVTEHDTQPSVRQNRPRWPGHVLYCDCVICDKLNEPYSP